MRAIKKLNAIRTIRYTGWVAGLLYIFLDLYIMFTVVYGKWRRSKAQTPSQRSEELE